MSTGRPSVAPEIIDTLERRSDEIARRYVARLHAEVLPYRAYTPEQLDDSARLFIQLFVTMLRTNQETSLPLELELVGRERAAHGISVGDQVIAGLLLLTVAREVHMESRTDGELRAALAAWWELERVAHSVFGWAADRRVERPSRR